MGVFKVFWSISQFTCRSGLLSQNTHTYFTLNRVFPFSTFLVPISTLIPWLTDQLRDATQLSFPHIPHNCCILIFPLLDTFSHVHFSCLIFKSRAATYLRRWLVHSHQAPPFVTCLSWSPFYISPIIIIIFNHKQHPADIVLWWAAPSFQRDIAEQYAYCVLRKLLLSSSYQWQSIVIIFHIISHIGWFSFLSFSSSFSQWVNEIYLPHSQHSSILISFK